MESLLPRSAGVVPLPSPTPTDALGQTALGQTALGLAPPTDQGNPTNPYEQPFTLEAALSLSLEDHLLPFHLTGYDLFLEAVTSKYHSHTIP